MNCAEARDSVQAALDGEISVPDGRSLVSHLASCVECRELRRDLEAVVAWAESVPTAADAGPDLAPRVVGAIRRERRTVLVRRWIAAASVAAAAVLWAALLPGLLRQPTATPPVAAPVGPPPTPAADQTVEYTPQEARALLNELKILSLTGKSGKQLLARAAEEVRLRRLAERLAKPKTARLAAAELAEKPGQAGVALLAEAARDPKLAPGVLAGVEGQARTELVPVYIAAMGSRDRACRETAAAMAGIATGLKLGGNPACWQAWWECYRSRQKHGTLLDAVPRRNPGDKEPAGRPGAETRGRGVPAVA